jgi:transposase
MLTNAHFERVYLARGSTDLRKSIDGLAVIVKECFDLDPFSPCLFVFCNRKRDKLKILQWEHNGFWLHYRRLERGTFHWPTSETDMDPPMDISPRQLRWLLDGLPLNQKQAHREVKARTIL